MKISSIVLEEPGCFKSTKSAFDTVLQPDGAYLCVALPAALPALQGMISDDTGSIHISSRVPLVCFLIVALCGLLAGKYERTSTKTVPERIS